jgi:DNA helicase MCM8
MSQTSTDACPFANWNPFLSDYPFQANTDLVPIINSTVDYFTTQLTMRLDDLQQDEFEALLTETICFIDATQIRSIPNIKFAVEIKQNPSRFLHALNLSATIAAQLYTEKFPWAQIQVNEKIVRILNYSNHTRLKDLKANMVGQFITIRGTAVRVSSVLPLVTTLEFQCTNCGTRQTTLFPDGKYKTPLKCTLHGCRGKNFKPDKSNGKTNSSIDWQRVRIQEKLANDQVDSGRVPRTVECELTRDLVDKIVPGDVVICTGIVKVLATEEGGNKNTTAQMYYLYIDANSINKTSCALDEEEGGSLAGKDFIEFSEKDLYGILEIHNFEGDLFQLLVHSLCPAIFGHEFVKAGILLTLMGGRKRETSVNQLKIRSDPHILVVGDPGLGKSQMLMSAVKLAPRG